MSTNFAELHNLPNAEKLRLVEALWDDIANSQEPFVLDSNQLDEIKRRRAELKADPSLAISREELWRRIDD